MAGTGANSVPLSHLHPILAAKLSAGGGQGASSGPIPLPSSVPSSTDKLERAKRAASALFPSMLRNFVYTCSHCIDTYLLCCVCVLYVRSYSFVVDYALSPMSGAGSRV